MKPWRALQSNPVCRVFAVVGVTLVISSWGFVPHRHLHAKAWASLPPELRLALGNDPTPLVARATDADSRKHTDSLEAARHYFDLDDAHAKGLELWGNPWSGAQQLLQEADSSASVRRLGMLPWQLEWSYWRLVRAWAPSDSSDPDLNGSRFGPLPRRRACSPSYVGQLRRSTHRAAWHPRLVGNPCRRVASFEARASSVPPSRRCPGELRPGVDSLGNHPREPCDGA